MPAMDTTYLGSLDTGAEKNGVKFEMSAVIPDDKSTLGVSSDVHQYRLNRYPGKIRSFGSSAFDVVLAATGEFQSALLTRCHLYDIAAAAIMLWAAGGGLYFLSGEKLLPTEFVTFPGRKSEPVLACHPTCFDSTRVFISD